MIEILRKIIHFIYRFSPKWNYAVIWGWPDYEDNVISLEQALQESSVTRIYLLMTNPDSTPIWELGAKTTTVKKNSLSGWLVFCCARYVFFTHRCFMKRFPPNVVSVNVWHGMPIKRIGWMLPGDQGISAKYTLATSEFWAKTMRKCMRPDGEVIATGLPRNDRLFLDPEKIRNKLDLPLACKLAAWLPTYRRSIRGDLRIDGNDTGSPFEMDGVIPEELNDFLRANNTVMIVKPHPMARIKNAAILSNLLIISDDWLKEKSVSLYEMLGATDFLVSDISSVVIDYLLLDRPVIHAFPDERKYSESRGFTVSPIEDCYVGPLATNSEELYEALRATIAGEDLKAAERRRFAKNSHKHAEGSSTKRLLKEIGLI